MFIIGSFLLMICTVLVWTKNVYYFTLLIAIIYLMLKKFNLKIVVALMCFLVIFALYIHPKVIDLDTVIEGTVILTNEYDYVLKTKAGKVKISTNNMTVHKGNYIKVKVEHKDFAPIANFNGFNQQMYCYSQKIFTLAKEVEILTNNGKLNLLGYIENYINQIQDERVKGYSKQLFLGIVDENMENISNVSRRLAIVHLFALSGMHLSIIQKFLKKLNIRNEVVLLLILGSYTYMLRHLVSIVRAYLMKLLGYLFKDRFNQIELLSLSGIVILLYNPYIIFSLSFIFSFTIYCFLILTKDLKFSHVFPMLASLPIILSTQYTLSLFSIVYSWLFSPIIEIVFYCILINLISFNVFSPILAIVLSIFERSLLVMNQTYIEIIMAKPGFIFIISYYGILLIIIYRLQLKLPIKRYSYSLICLIMLLYIKPYYSLSFEVTMINVGQGDSIFIKLPFNKGNYLIDTGGNQSYDVATTTIIPYLKSKGIKKLDGLIVTHDDFDHSGAMQSLMENFKVEKLITEGQNIGPLYYLQTDLNSENSNDLSLVYYLNVNGIGYLFTGDLPIEGEDIIIQQYPNLNIDILKVGHHGSKTSTGTKLLSHFKPNIGLISVGKYNLYGHPNLQVLQRLEAYGLKIYRTDLNGMISSIHIGKFHKIKTAS